MTSWETNKAAIRELWPNATIPQALAELFADKLQHLDQGVLAKAIREARVAAKYPTPEIREILEAYHKAKRLDSSGWQPRAYEPPLPLSPGVDPETEHRTAKEIDILLQDVDRSTTGVEDLIRRILDAMDANQIGPPAAHRKLVPLQVMRMLLRGKTVHPVGLERATKVWPDIDEVTSEYGDDYADEIAFDETAAVDL